VGGSRAYHPNEGQSASGSIDAITLRETMGEARQLAAKALQLDDGLADAHIAVANVLFPLRLELGRS
jgi:hypothetical protein